jgi:hypothetical protein
MIGMAKKKNIKRSGGNCAVLSNKRGFQERSKIWKKRVKSGRGDLIIGNTKWVEPERLTFATVTHIITRLRLRRRLFLRVQNTMNYTDGMRLSVRSCSKVY